MIAFGPVHSRRLGMSLGINNIVSQKKCSYACVYCQIGMTGEKTMIRSDFYEPGYLVKEIENHLKRLKNEDMPDYMTFVANGEPALDRNLGKEIAMLKELGFPIAVITNASLIDRQDVRDDLMSADWVSVKVDAIDEKTWRKINQPCKGIHLNRILEGIKIFASEYEGKLQTETMLAEGFNDATCHLGKLSSYISGLAPLIAYLSVPTRPPAVKQVNGVSEKKLTEAWQIFDKKGIRTELLTGFEGTGTGFTGNVIDDILNITAVHPLREDTMEELLRRAKADMTVVSSLLDQKLIKEVQYKGRQYFVRYYHQQPD
ncbi:MAG: radical SAM protein [Bacteroidales bacterium]|jgi:wyosine [tRNA(Phe)-imidazoG37] synthetase (radical SAM superfamily)